MHLVLLGCYVLVQLLFPLRPFLYPGNANWTMEGQNFSWRMMLTDRRASEFRLEVTDVTQRSTWEIDAGKVLLPKQYRKMTSDPDLMLQYAHFISDTLQQEGAQGIEVRMRALVSLNGRAPQALIDPDVDLASQPRTLWPKPWIKR